MSRAAQAALFLGVFWLAPAFYALTQGRGGSRAAPTAGTVTFTKDVAPILFKNCADCHHPGGPGPFSLLNYAEAKRHAQQIAAVTARRFMPPWLPAPAPAYAQFAGERRLSASEIHTLEAWAREGAGEGDPSDLPPVPQFQEGWQLGEPDLIVKLSRPFLLPAGGPNVFRNFVFSIPVTRTRYVRAVEILPGNNQVVHHANLLVDRTRSARLLDGKDSQPGFPGMDLEIESPSFDPDSHFLFWKPGTLPYREPDEMSWRLDPGTDLVLNMHLQPSGKPESIQPSLGLYFTDQAPTQFPMLLQLEHDGALDIPPGDARFVITDQLKLPVDVQVLGVYPHAHYLGKEIEGYATLADGTRKWLLRINDWDLNWQAVYRYVKPIFLPKGTTLAMRITYDNSSDNVRNPNHPPQRVRAGNNATDEMGHLWVQVLPRRREDLKLLQVAVMQRRLERYPHDFFANANLGAVYLSWQKSDEAVKYFREASRIKPADPVAQNSLGAALQMQGHLEEALDHFRQALASQPEYADAHYNLGNALLSLGRPEEAAEQFREVLRLNASDADTHDHLGIALAAQGDLSAAAEQFEMALRLDGNHADAHYNLGNVLARQGKLEQAATQFQLALRFDPHNADIHNDLGSVLALQGKTAQAAEQFQTALRLNPGHAQAGENLRRLRAQLAKER